MSEYLDRPLRSLKEVLAERRARKARWPREKPIRNVPTIAQYTGVVRRDPTRMERHEETYEDRLDDPGESPDY